MKGMVLCIVSTLATLSFGSPEPAVGHLRAVPAADVTASAPAAANTAALDLSPLRYDKISADITILAFTGITLGTRVCPWGRHSVTEAQAQEGHLRHSIKRVAERPV
jgi:hypothetical protein